MASVEIQTPDGPMRVRLDRDHLTIGRLSSNDIALPYPHISRSHAELRLQGQTWWVVDLRSTNGLHVGGQRVRESRLAPGVAVQLSPQITLALLEDAIPPSYAPSSPPVSPPGYAPTPAAPPARVAPQPSYPPGYPPSYPPGYPPTPPAAPMPKPAAATARAPAPEPIPPLSALGPRSPYADDEAPFYPQMRPMRPAYHDHPTYAPAQPAWPPQAMRPTYAPASPAPSMAPLAPLSVQPSAELLSGALDPQGQTARAFEERRNAQAGPSPLLHVCQTCGQRTQPDAVYCQSCHHSIASECPRCRLSLLPIQDLCPRCQAPNPHSARRARRTAQTL